MLNLWRILAYVHNRQNSEALLQSIANRNFKSITNRHKSTCELQSNLSACTLSSNIPISMVNGQEH